MSFLVANLPPTKVYVKKQYLYDHQKGHGEFVEGVWVSCKSIQGRALYFETYLPEYGALYDKLPISAFVDSPTELDIELEELELWDICRAPAGALQISYNSYRKSFSIRM